MALSDQGPLAASQATEFTIKILDSDSPFASIKFDARDDLGLLKLRGRQLPYRPYKLSGTQRLKTTYYPANPEATQQVMGGMEANTTITGFWHDRFLGDSEAHRLATIFDDLRRTGTLIEVSWGNSPTAPSSQYNKAEVRQGVIKRFDSTWDRAPDIAWECEFEWRGRGDPVQRPTFSAPLTNPREGFVDMQAKLGDATDAVQAVQDSPYALLTKAAASVQSRINTGLAALQTIDNQLIQVGSAITLISQLDNQTILKVRGMAFDAVGHLALIEGALLDFKDSQQTLDTKDLALGRLNRDKTSLDTLQTTGIAKETAAIQASALQAMIQPDVIAEVRPVPGTDLRDLALQFYGDPDAWGIIARFNGLVSSRVPSGPTGPSDNAALPIRVPKQSTALAALPC